MNSESVRVLAVVGESQHGKSSFINTISGSWSQRVGSGDGKSCTIDFYPIKFQDHLQLFGSCGAQICCDDIPGFGDTGMRISNRQILESLKPRLVGLGRKEIDALLVFQSIAESRIELARTFTYIEEMFGPSITQSTIVLVTKSDMIVESVKMQRLATVSDITSTKNIQYVVWINDSADDRVEEGLMQRQIASLKTALERITPYTIKDLEEFEHLVEQKAELLMAQDKNNIVQQKITFQVQKAELYTVKESISVPTVVPKYSEEKVKELAQQKASIYPKAEVVKVKSIITVDSYTPVDEEITVNTKSYFLWYIPVYGTAQVPTQTVKKTPIEREIINESVHFVPRDASEFEEELRDQQIVEIVQEERDVEKVQMREATETVAVTITKHDIDHYKRKAGKIIAQERWRQNAS